MLNIILKYFMFFMVLMVLTIPSLEKALEFLPDRELKGSFEVAEEPIFNLNDWSSGKFQVDYETFWNDHIGGREYLVRIRNQYYFSAYNIALANSVFPGKNGVLFTAEYVNAFYGKDFAGAEFLEDKLTRWKHVERGLDSIGVKAALVLVPGKASYFEADFPDRLKDEHQPITNYRFIDEWAANNDVRLLDLKKLYHAWMDTSRYSLYPKGGIHWSDYGVAHVCDTLRGYIQSITGCPLQELWFDIEISEEPRRVDNDIAELMNLLFTPKERGLAYPKRYFGVDSSIAPTRLLTIADSYYYGILSSGFADRICSYGGFWYYFKKAIPPSLFGAEKVEELDIIKHLKNQDVLLLLMTEPQLRRFGWGAVEELEKALYPDTISESETTR